MTKMQTQVLMVASSALYYRAIRLILHLCLVASRILVFYDHSETTRDLANLPVQIFPAKNLVFNFECRVTKTPLLQLSGWYIHRMIL